MANLANAWGTPVLNYVIIMLCQLNSERAGEMSWKIMLLYSISHYYTEVATRNRERGFGSYQ